MREIVFLKDNYKRWQKTEAIIQGREKVSPDQKADFFVHISDDLAFAQTNYPNSPTTTYLNQLSTQMFRLIHKNKHFHLNRFFEFWQVKLPISFFRERRMMLISLLLFAVFVLIGIISVHFDIDFAKVVLGDSYIHMTEQNIDMGDPVAVYRNGKDGANWYDESLYSFVRIALNNIRVSLLAYLGGVAFGIGTIYMLFHNGVMLGAFQWFFYKKGVLITSFLTIWIHGTIEISCIIIAGMAGLVLGSGALYPDTYSRKVSFIRRAQDSLKIMLGIIPLIIMAALLEGFVSGETHWHWFVKLVIILLSLGFVLYFFVIRPYQVARRER